MDLLESARAKMPAGVQEVVKSAAAKYAVKHGDLARAQAVIDPVVITPDADSVYNFSDIANPNRNVVQQMIAAARARAA